jgi:hypothetical protein
MNRPRAREQIREIANVLSASGEHLNEALTDTKANVAMLAAKSPVDGELAEMLLAMNQLLANLCKRTGDALNILADLSEDADR